MKVYEISKEYTALAKKIVKAVDELSYINDYGVKFVVLTSEEKKTINRKIIYGDCEKVKDKYKEFIPYDFIITLYEPNTDLLSDTQIKVLLWHELRHIGADDEFARRIVPHDREDFDSIIEAFGIDWNEEGKDISDILKGAEV